MILTGKNIRKTYTQDQIETPVLKGINITVHAGEFVAIIGKSGSGKSTLLHILSGLDTPDSGEVFFEEQEITHRSEEETAKLRRESFGFVFQLPKMVKSLNLLDNILLPSTSCKTHKKETLDKAKRLMRTVEIETLADKKISQVSGGQLQRAGICRALINDPKILFADEPTGALDSKTSQEVLRLFENVHSEGKTILLVTHDLQVASKAERVLLMKDGLLHQEIRCKEFRDPLPFLEEAIRLL